MGKAKPDTVSAEPLFAWFEQSKDNRARLREAKYTDGRITNWKQRGIPRGQIEAVANHMGMSYQQYLVAAGERKPDPIKSGAISDEALQIAMAFDKMTPQTQDRIREHVYIYAVMDNSYPWLRTGKPVSKNYDAFEKWHEDNKQVQITLEVARIVKKR